MNDKKKDRFHIMKMARTLPEEMLYKYNDQTLRLSYLVVNHAKLCAKQSNAGSNSTANLNSIRRIENEVEELCKILGLKYEFYHDPRGYTAKIFYPDKLNDFDSGISSLLFWIQKGDW